jgi:AraC-like DNA-binding protein
MEFALHHPGPPLSHLVESITWFAKVRPLHHREKLIPDGAIQIIVDLSERPKKLYAGETAPGFIDYRQAWISGMHRKPIVIEAQPLASMVVIRFQPGGAYPFLGHAAEALTDDVFALDAVLGPRGPSLRERILNAETGAAKIAAAEAWLLEQAAGAKLHPLIRHLTARLKRPAGLRIADLVEETGYTERHIRDLFRRWIGVSPKQYARIRRFQQVLQALASAGESNLELTGRPLPRPDWANVAADLCFSDQSHFSHEFSAFAGMTPSAYLSAYRGLENYLPITLGA